MHTVVACAVVLLSLIISILILLSWCLHRYIVLSFKCFRNRKIPYVKPEPYFGSMRNAFLQRRSFGEEVKIIYDENRTKKYVGFFASRMPHILLRDLAMIKHVLVVDFSFFQDRTTLDLVEDNCSPIWKSIFFIGGSRWKILRKILSEYFFSRQYLSKCYRKVVECTHELTEAIEREISEGNDEFDISEIVSVYCANTASYCTIGDKIDNKVRKSNLNVGLFERWNKIKLYCWSFLPYIMQKLKLAVTFDSEYDWSNAIDCRVKCGIDDERDDIIDRMLRYVRPRFISVQKSTKDIVCDEDLIKIDYEDAFPLLDFDEDLVKAQAYTVCTSAYEASRSAIISTLYELARHPDVQNIVHEEIDDTLEKYNVISYEALLSMQYLDMVLSEALRMHPPICTIARACARDYGFSGDRLKLVRGDNLIVSVLGLHMDPSIWPNPEKFTPERFAPEKIKQRHLCAYMPFGLGPRYCLGVRYAKLQCLSALLAILSRYYLEMDPTTRGAGGVTVHPVAVVRFRPRLPELEDLNDNL